MGVFITIMQGPPKRTVSVDMESQRYKEFKRLLFRHGLTMQQFINYVLVVGEKQDKRVMSLLREAKERKVSQGLDGFLLGKKTRNPGEIYSLLEQGSATNRLIKATREHNEDYDYENIASDTVGEGCNQRDKGNSAEEQQ